MNEAQIRQIIQQELSAFMGVGGFMFDRNIKIFDARHIQLGKTTGTKIGTEATQKIGFFGVTPVVQQSVSAVGVGGAQSDGVARAGVDAIRAKLIALGLFS